MRSKPPKALVWLFALLILLGGTPPASADSGAADKAQSILDGITAFQLEKTGASSVQEWIDGALASGAAASEWYALALSQYGSFDLSLYRGALLNDLKKNEVYSASSRQKYALVLIACGSTDAYIFRTLNDSIGRQGVMSWIFGLHLLNNGYTSREYSLSDVTKKLLSLQQSNGGWAVTGTRSDADATAMAVQALAPLYPTDAAVKSAIDKALMLLSSLQTSTGDYASYGVNNPESTAQVLVALSSLGIDCRTDSRFIKNGSTLFDGLALYRLADGSFCHKQGGGFTETATVQVFYAMVSYLRLQNGQPPLYLLDRRNPSGLEVPSDPDETGSSPGSDSAPPATEQPVGGTTAPTVSADQTGSDPAAESAETDSSSAPEETPSADTAQDASAVTEAGQPNSREPDGGGYKGWVCLAIVLTAGGICVILYCRKKRNIRNFAVVGLIAAAAAVIVVITDFQSTDAYYREAQREKADSIGTVSITIRCDTVPDKSAAHLPDDGVMLDITEFEIEQGDTVYDILAEAAAANKIHLETSGSGEAVYVRGIGNLYEFDFGDLSGWMYSVNGETPSVGCGEYRLSADDAIEWLYTCELGSDPIR